MSRNAGSKHLHHPLHPIFTHFPMALWMISLLWDLLGLLKRDPFWWNFAYWSIAVGLIFAFFAVVTGLIDYIKVPQGAAEGIALRHMLFVVTAAVLYMGSFFARFGHPILSGNRLIIALAFSILGFVLLLIGGWYGGELVYRYGAGKKETTPNENSERHRKTKQ